MVYIMSMIANLIIEPKPSKSLAFCIGLVHGISLIAAFINAWSFLIESVIASLTLLSFYFNIRHHWLHPSIQGLKIKEDGRCTLFMFDERIVNANLLADTWMTPWLIILHLKTQQGRQTLLICKDSLDADAFRQLRVKLKLSHLNTQ